MSRLSLSRRGFVGTTRTREMAATADPPSRDETSAGERVAFFFARWGLVASGPLALLVAYELAHAYQDERAAFDVAICAPGLVAVAIVAWAPLRRAERALEEAP